LENNHSGKGSGDDNEPDQDESEPGAASRL
jgi:hypothetical protein